MCQVMGISGGTRQEVERWLEVFSDCVRQEDFERARPMFSQDVLGFGSRTRRMEGLSDLESRQWRFIWPHSRHFTFDVNTMRLEGTDDIVCVMSEWSSTGFHGDGTRYERPGRSTIVLRRAQDGQFQAVHTHFSLVPGTPELTVRTEGADDSVADASAVREAAAGL